MLIRVFFILLMVCCLLPAPLSTAARPTDANTVFIYGQINEFNEGESDFPRGRSNFSLAYFATVRDILIKEGFDPVFVALNPDDPFPNFFESDEDYQKLPGLWQKVLVVGPTPYGEDDWVNLTQFAHYQFPGLPMGTYGLSLVPRISADRFASLQEVARLTAGLALYTSHHCAQALPYLVEASSNDALMADGLLLYGGTMFYRASCEYDQGLIDEAAASYQAVIDFPYEPGDTDLRQFSYDAAINLAWIAAQQGKLDEGIALLDAYSSFTVDAYYQRDMERYLKRADVYFALGAHESAIAEVTTIIEIAEQDDIEFPPDVMARLYTERGERYLRLDELPKALADFDQAIQVDDEYPKVYYWRGMLHQKSGEADLAKADFEQFLALAPGYYQYYEDDLVPYIEQASTILTALK